MRRCVPLLKTTAVSSDLREWVPSTFDNLRREVKYLSQNCEGDDPAILFRGQTNSDWLLDCTLARSLLMEKPLLRDRYPRPLSFHAEVVDALLAKFERFCKAGGKVLSEERSDGTDAGYECMRRFQQYAEEDMAPPQGTFLIDWTIDPNVALYFATYDGKNDRRRCRQTPGAMWVYDAVATGKVLQAQPVGDVLSLMRQDDFRLKAERTLALIFHPSPQKPVYVAQMDFRYDLADVWCSIEDHGASSVFKKLILTESLLQDAIRYLENQGVTEGYVYPQ